MVHIVVKTPVIILLHNTMSDNSNPGNFSNCPYEEVQDIARKGGHSSQQGGFASMDADKQVSKSFFHLLQYSKLTTPKRDTASKGGHASSASFEPGDTRAKEAGRKGGQSTGQPDK